MRQNTTLFSHIFHRFLHISHVENFSTWQSVMWRITPHDNLSCGQISLHAQIFSTSTARGARDKYEVCIVWWESLAKVTLIFVDSLRTPRSEQCGQAGRERFDWKVLTRRLICFPQAEPTEGHFCSNRLYQLSLSLLHLLRLMLWPLAVTPGVTHVGAYHHPSDSNFWLQHKLSMSWTWCTIQLLEYPIIIDPLVSKRPEKISKININKN